MSVLRAIADGLVEELSPLFPDCSFRIFMFSQGTRARVNIDNNFGLYAAVPHTISIRLGDSDLRLDKPGRQQPIIVVPYENPELLDIIIRALKAELQR